MRTYYTTQFRSMTSRVRNQQWNFIGQSWGIRDSYWPIRMSIKRHPWLMCVLLPRWKQGWNGLAIATAWKVGFIIILRLPLPSYKCTRYFLSFHGN